MVFFRKVRTFAQIVGLVCIALFTVYGGLAALGQESWVSQAYGRIMHMASAQAEPLEGDPINVPPVMYYQGILKDAAGEPLNGLHTMLNGHIANDDIR